MATETNAKGMGIALKVALPGVVLALVTCGLAFFVIQYLQRELAIDQAQQTAVAISQQVAADRQIYTSEVVDRVRAQPGITIAANYRSTTGGIPLPATFVHRTSAAVNARTEGRSHTIDLLSEWPINRDRAPRTAFEREALAGVAADPKTPHTQVDGNTFYAVVADVANAQSCVNCHNAHPDSPRHDFRLNQVMGGLVISLPMEKAFAEARSNAILLTLGLLAIFALLLVVQWATVNRPMVNSLVGLQAAADAISKGDVGRPITTDRTDEIGRLSNAFERMRASVAAAMEGDEKDSDDF